MSIRWSGESSIYSSYLNDLVDFIDIIDYNDGVASILIRNFDDSLKEALRRRAAVNRRSMEEEARLILGLELRRDRSLKGGLAERIHEIAMEIGGMDDLVIPPRSEMVRTPPLEDE